MPRVQGGNDHPYEDQVHQQIWRSRELGGSSFLHPAQQASSILLKI